MMSLSRRKCCVPGCIDSESSHRTLHLFPNPAKDRERFNQWVLSIGGNIIGLENEDIYKHRSVCHAHFEEKFCCRNDRLSNIAVPTLKLPGPLSLPKFTFEERRPMRYVQNDLLPTSRPAMALISVPPLTPSTSVPLAMPSTSVLPATLSTSVPAAVPLTSMAQASVLAKESQSGITNQENIDPVMEQLVRVKTAPELVDKDCHNIKSTSGVTKTAKKHVRVTPAEQKLYQKLVEARIRLSKCRNKLKKQSASLKAAKKLTSNAALLATIEMLPRAAKILTMMQFREVKKKSKGRRFSLQEKILALSIFKQAPKGYRFLRKILTLPAPQTLAKVIRQAGIKPGINQKMLQKK